MTNLEKLDIELAQAKIQIEALFRDWNARQEANIKALHEVSDKLIERLDNIQSNLNVNIQGSRKKDFLTLDEVRAKGLPYYVYTENESVYEYTIKGKGRTLVENGKILCENVAWFYWYSKGVYQYKIKGKGYTLIENGVKLCENVAWCHWYSKGMYEYKQTANSDWVKVGS